MTPTERKELVEKLYIKYKGFYKYSYSEIKKYYDKRKNRFKSMSMDFNDLTQELYPIIFESVKKYDEKYTSEKKVYIKKYLKNRVYWALSNILRNKKPLTLYKFVIEEEFYYVDDDEKNKNNSSDESITELINKYCKNDREKDIMISKIIDNFTFEKIGKIKGISKQRVGQIFNNVISKMKKEIKNIDMFNELT